MFAVRKLSSKLRSSEQLHKRQTVAERLTSRIGGIAAKGVRCGTLGQPLYWWFSWQESGLRNPDTVVQALARRR